MNMKKSAIERRLSATKVEVAPTATQGAAAPAKRAGATLTMSANTAARRLLGQGEQRTADQGGSICAVTTGAQPRVESYVDWPGLSALKERCMAFGIDASSAELMAAGLQLLSEQTDTALEVAMLQSLRADRSTARRRSKR
jgi:hypothetical protein